jgi:murein DD-endopeptidase MepM/ murein hydrolase activator NlpD
MAGLIRRCLAVALAASAAAFGPFPFPAHAAVTHTAKIEVSPGTVVRWSSPRTKRCVMGGRAWPAMEETCYYPVDLFEKPGVIRISRRGIGAAELAQISVAAYPYDTEDIVLGDIPQANPSAADLQRNGREQARLAKVWSRHEGPARFTLPLGAPVSPRPDGKGFGDKWIFNGKPDASELHTGADYALSAGTPVAAAADGTVVVAEDLFFPGNAVFIDHGDGLITMYFHLSEIKVQVGNEVKRGDIIGLVGLTGRASGPHLHVGVRWHNARVDPQFLFGDPSKIPAVGP